MTKSPPDPFAGLAELQRRTADALQPYVDLQWRLKSIDYRSPVINAIESAAKLAAERAGIFEVAAKRALQQRSDMIDAALKVFEERKSVFEAAAKMVADRNEAFAELVRKSAGWQQDLAERIATFERHARALDEAGFLPHVTTPLHLLDECGEDHQALSVALERHYVENWSAVRSQLEARVDSYSVDDEAKQSFREALDAHEHGLYRSVCRHLFVEIERVVRFALCEGRLGGMASVPDLQEIAGTLSVTEVEPRGYLGIRLFERLTEHLYVPVWDENLRKQMEQDPVPNRHAAIHGLVVYRSFKNSINTILMTDYILQIVHTVITRVKEPAAIELQGHAATGKPASV